ncbi:MAG: hypothetical protein QM737_12740 [Ferruginibacter sp.]
MPTNKNKSKAISITVISLVLLLITGGIYYAYTKTDLLGDRGQANQPEDYLSQQPTTNNADGLKKLSTLGGLLVGQNEKQVEEVLGKPDLSIRVDKIYYNKAINDMTGKVCTICVTINKVELTNSGYFEYRVVKVKPLEPGTVLYGSTQNYIVPDSN